jgi:hypothetical protein
MCSFVGTCSVLLWAALLLRAASAHSFLLAPNPDWTVHDRPECRMGGTDGYTEDCGGPCGTDRNFFNPDKQPVTFSRGQYVNMQWAKNNHFSGFVRFTLVPKNSRMDFSSHDQFAFRYACWEAGKTHCSSGEFCGTDMEGIKYTANVQIPPVYPDGEYVLGWSWYGGSKYFPSEELQNNYGISSDPGHRSEYGDYFSCTNIRIQGGTPVQDQYKPIFETGQSDRTGDTGGTCASAVNKLGMCAVEPCGPRYPVSNMVPEPFDGKSPPAIKASDLGYSGGNNDQGSSNTDQSNGTTVPPSSTTSSSSTSTEPSTQTTSESTTSSNTQSTTSSAPPATSTNSNSPNGSNQDSQSSSESTSSSESSNQNEESTTAPSSTTSSNTQNSNSNGASSPPDFTSLDFINSNDQSVLYSTITDSGSEVTLLVKDIVGQFSLRANTVGSVREVRFLAKLKNNQATVLDRTEVKAPYFIAGDNNGNGVANAWQNAPVDNWIDLSLTLTSTDGNQKSKQVYLYFDTTGPGRR